MKLYIIRHGETKLNALGRLQGWTCLLYTSDAADE